MVGMKITKIDIMMIDTHPVDNPNWEPIVCRVYTDEGIYGDGEAALAFGRASRAAFGMLQDLSPLVIGMDPLDHEVIWEKLYKATFWAQNGGPVIFAGISAIDTALWDIKGKYFQVPVYKLLGGKMRESLRCYASQLQYGWGKCKTPACSLDDYTASARAAVEEGYDAVKFDFLDFDEHGHRFSYEETTRTLSHEKLDLVISRLAAVREAVGPKVDIIMENHANIDAQGAVQLAKLAEPYDVLFFEEPATPNPKLYRFVSERVRIPLAQGERLYSRWDYAPYLEDGSVQLLQLDIGNCGGVTEAKKICDMAHIYDVGMQAHVCASPLSVAVALQLEAAVPNFVIHEHHVYNRYDYNRALCIYDYQPENGHFAIPELPGLGNELSSYCFEHSIKATVK